MPKRRIIKGAVQVVGLCMLVIVTLFPQSSELNTQSGERVNLVNAIEGQHLEINKNNKSASRSPRVFVCGFDLWNFSANLFGDLAFAGRFESASDALPSDVLLQGGLNGPCSSSPDSSFPGRILYIHSESRTGGDAEKQLWNERFFKIGPSDSSERSLPIVSFGAIFFASATTKEQRTWIIDPARKQKSTYVWDAAVYVVNQCRTFRNEAAIELSEALDMKIHQNPKCPKRNSNFVSIPKEIWTGRNAYYENWKLYRKYKYCLVFENTATSNYVTEKIFMAFMGGCIPIYWGTRDIFDIFNAKAFVYYNKDNPEQALQEIKLLQDDDLAYQEKVQAPILAHGNETIEKYLSLADGIGNGSLKHQIRSMMGLP